MIQLDSETVGNASRADLVAMLAELQHKIEETRARAERKTALADLVKPLAEDDPNATLGELRDLLDPHGRAMFDRLAEGVGAPERPLTSNH